MKRVESITELKSFSFSYLDATFSPCSAELGPFSSFIMFNDYLAAEEATLRMMNLFNTKNHFEILSIPKRKTRYTVEMRFETDKHEYLLTRYFVGVTSTESKLERLGTGIFFSGKDAITKLKSMVKPITINNGDFYSNRCVIFKPTSEIQRKEIVRTVNSWLKTINAEGRVELDYDCIWRFIRNNFDIKQAWTSNRIPAYVRLLYNIAQALMRKRIYGYCPPSISYIELHSLSVFESVSVLRLAKEICSTHGLNFVMLFGEFQGSEMIEITTIPHLEIDE